MHAPALKKNADSLLKWEAEQQEINNKLNSSESYIPIRDRADSEDSDESEPKLNNTTTPIVMNELFLAYSKSLVLAGLVGGSTSLPSIGSSGTLFKVRTEINRSFLFTSLKYLAQLNKPPFSFLSQPKKLGASGVSPQYGAWFLLVLFYWTEFHLVR